MTQGNPSIENLKKSEELFKSDESTRIITVIAEHKNDDGNLFTKSAFTELLAFDTILHEIVDYTDTTEDPTTGDITRPKQGVAFTFDDMCK